MLRTKRKSNRETSLYEPIGTDREGNEIRLYDVIESDEEDACMQLALKNVFLFSMKNWNLFSPTANS